VAESTTPKKGRKPAWLAEKPANSYAPGNADERALAVTLQGSKPRFVSEDESFAIWSATRDDDGSAITLQGALARCSSGEMLRCDGAWKRHPKHGWSFRVEAYQSGLPVNEDGIQRWLQTRVKGIGPTFAKAITDAFGATSFDVIDADPNVLYTLKTPKGTSLPKKAVEQVVAEWGAVRAMRQIESWLYSHGITAAISDKLYREYGDAVIEVLETEPYSITNLRGVGFLTADQIARSLGIAMDDPRRIRAGIGYILTEGEGEGHTFLTRLQLLERCSNVLKVNTPHTLVEQASELVHEGNLVVEDDGEGGQRVYRARTHRLEARLARRIRQMLDAPMGPLVPRPAKPTLPEGMSEDEARERHIYVPTDAQWAAVEMCVSHRLSLLTGLPGTGKSASQEMIIQQVKAAGKKVLLAAPTGKAAYRMTELTGEPASTIHRLLEWSPMGGGFQKDESNPLECDLLVIDEASMLALDLADSLLRAVGPATHVLLVGDENQLPPVGLGKFFADLLACEDVPRVMLDKIFRQAESSQIIQAASAIHSGKTPHLTHAQAEKAYGREMLKDFFWRDSPDAETTARVAVEFAAERIPNAFGFDPLREVMVIAPMYKGPCGINVLNDMLQARLNPDGRPVGLKNIRVGDRVIQTRNDYTYDTRNGTLAVVTDYDPDTSEMTLELDDERTIVMPTSDGESLTLAYAVSVHKMQGSQVRAAVCVQSTAHYTMLTRALVYTAITRAQQLVVMVGEKKALSMAVAKQDMRRRNSLLTERITDAALSGELF